MSRLAFLLVLLLTPRCLAGLHYSGETFAELPCQMVTESRWRCAANELDRLAQLGLLPSDLRAALTADVARFRAELDALAELRKDEYDSVFPSLE